MLQQRMDIRMIKDILRLKYQGDLSHAVTARSLSISKEAVAKYLSLADAAGLDWASTVGLDEASLERQLMGDGAALIPALAAACHCPFGPRAGFFVPAPNGAVPSDGPVRGSSRGADRLQLSV